MPRKEHHSTSTIISGFLYTELAALPLDSPDWFAWLELRSTFYFDSPLGTFTARCEQRANAHFWYAFRRYHKQLFKAYLGRSPDLTSTRLLRIARLLTHKAGA